MEITERNIFNANLIQFCANKLKWSPGTDETEELGKFTTCIDRVIIAEQLFRAAILSPIPGSPPILEGYSEDE